MQQKCSTCGSDEPHLHPAVQHGGEVQLCLDDFHLQETPQNKQEYKDAVLPKREMKAAKTCEHKNSECVYESDDGEFERWQCKDCGIRFGVEIPQ